MTGRRLDERGPTEVGDDSDGTRLQHPERWVEAEATATNTWESESLAGRVLRPRTLLSFAIAIALVVLAFQRFNLDVAAVTTEIRQANPLYFTIAFVTYFGSFAIRALRWRSLLNSADVTPAHGYRIPGMPGLIVIYILSWFANCLVPAKLGDAYRGYLLKQRSRTSFSQTLGTIFAERLADVVTLAIVLVGSGILVFGGHIPATVSTWMIAAVALGVALVIGIGLVFRLREPLRRLVPQRVRHHYVRLEQGTLDSFGRVWALLGLTMVIWLLEGVRVYFVGLSLGADISTAAALFIALLASLLTVVPITPAGLGFVELGMVGVLSIIGVEQQTAASVALLDRVIAYWSVIVIGAMVYLLIRWKWR